MHMIAQYRVNKFTTRLKINDPFTPAKFDINERRPSTTNTTETIGDHFCPLNAPLVINIRRTPIAINTIPITALNPANIPINPPAATTASAPASDAASVAAPNRLEIIPCKNRNAIFRQGMQKQFR